MVACLSSIYFFEKKEQFEIIVVDNNSTDGSSASIASLFPNVILIKNLENAGFPAANNQGFRVAKGKYIFMLNPDTELVMPVLDALMNYLDAHPEEAILAPALLNSDGSHQRSVMRYPKISHIFTEMFYADNLLTDKYYKSIDVKKCQPVDAAIGAALFFRKSLIEKIGMLDERLFWIEDIDFCYRANQLAGKTIYYPSVSIKHHSGKSISKNYKIALSNQVFNKIKFYHKHFPGLPTFIVKFISFFNVFFRLIASSIFAPFSDTASKKMNAYAYTLTRINNPPESI